MYATYEYYQSTYGGIAIPEDQWPAFARQADAYIDQATFGRLRRGWAVTDQVQNACCALADVAYNQYQVAEKFRSKRGLQSESVGKQSVSYQSQADMDAAFRQERADVLNLYLPSWSPLRYAGVKSC